MIFPLFEPTFYEAEGRAVTMARQAGGGACRARPRGERIFVASRSAGHRERCQNNYTKLLWLHPHSRFTTTISNLPHCLTHDSHAEY